MDKSIGAPAHSFLGMHNNIGVISVSVDNCLYWKYWFEILVIVANGNISDKGSYCPTPDVLIARRKGLGDTGRSTTKCIDLSSLLFIFIIFN